MRFQIFTFFSTKSLWLNVYIIYMYIHEISFKFLVRTYYRFNLFIKPFNMTKLRDSLIWTKVLDVQNRLSHRLMNIRVVETMFRYFNIQANHSNNFCYHQNIKLWIRDRIVSHQTFRELTNRLDISSRSFKVSIISSFSMMKKTTLSVFLRTYFTIRTYMFTQHRTHAILESSKWSTSDVHHINGEVKLQCRKDATEGKSRGRVYDTTYLVANFCNGV